jgi:hypothetical protein
VGSILGNQVLGLKSAGYSTPLICPGIYLQDAGDGVSVVENRVTHAFDAINTQGTDAWTIIGNRFVDTRNDALLVLASRRGVAEDNRINGTIGRGIIVEGGDGPPVAVAAYPGITPTGVVASRNNVFRDNTSIDNFGRDCVDQTTGTRTKGTANTWVRNEGDGNDQPNGLCPVR